MRTRLATALAAVLTFVLLSTALAFTAPTAEAQLAPPEVSLRAEPGTIVVSLTTNGQPVGTLDVQLSWDPTVIAPVLNPANNQPACDVLQGITSCGPANASSTVDVAGLSLIGFSDGDVVRIPVDELVPGQTTPVTVELQALTDAGGQPYPDAIATGIAYTTAGDPSGGGSVSFATAPKSLRGPGTRTEIRISLDVVDAAPAAIDGRISYDDDKIAVLTCWAPGDESRCRIVEPGLLRFELGGDPIESRDRAVVIRAVGIAPGAADFDMSVNQAIDGVDQVTNAEIDVVIGDTPPDPDHWESILRKLRRLWNKRGWDWPFG